MKNRVRCSLLFLAGMMLAHVGIAASEPAGDIKVWPLFYRASDPVSGITRTEVFWPLYVREKTPDYTVNQFLSFPQRYPTQYPRQYYLGWPLSGLRVGKGHDAWLFPFLWSTDDHFTLFPVIWYGDDYFSLFPAFYYDNDDGHTLNIAMLQHNSWSSNRRLHALWPLFWYKASRSDTDHRNSIGMLPLYWHSESAWTNRDSWSAFQSGGTLLLHWWSRSQRESSGAYSSTATNASDGLFPLFYRSRSDRTDMSDGKKWANHDDWLWLALYQQSHETCAAVTGGLATVTAAESHHTLFPFWWNWNESRGNTNDSGHLLFPFWWRSTQTRGTDLVESATFLVPVGAHLFKKGEYETQNVLGPMFNRTENKVESYVRYDAFFPLFSATHGRERSGGRLFPLTGWESQRGKYSNLWYLFPFGWSTESQEGPAYRVNAPQFWALHEMERKPFINEADCGRSGPRRTVAFYPLAWSKRQADIQSSGMFPFWLTQTWRSGATVSHDVCLPLLLGQHETSWRDDVPVYSRQDYLLSILAWGRGEKFRLRRFFPFFSYQDSYGRRDISSFVLPFSYETWRDLERPEQHYTSELSVPFEYLPLFRSRMRHEGTNFETRASWLFPFYKHSTERSAERDVEKLSVLWPLWNGEWENDETRIRGLGGVVNSYERDCNQFVEQRILYRLFTRRTRSWFSEYELMPFYSRQSREDGDAYWKILGGLLGFERRGDRSYVRFLFIPIPAGTASRPSADRMAAQQMKHADLALNYVQHSRHDRAAIEFALAGSARAEDCDFQLAAARAYLEADAEAIGRELRSSVPSSLESLGGKGGYSDASAVRMNLRCLAIRYFENAIRLGADKPDTLCGIAAAYVDMSQPEAALEKLAESDRLRPAFAVGMERLSVLGRLAWEGGWPRVLGRDTALEKQRIRQFREQWAVLLRELRDRYPDSPSLVQIEAGAPEDNETGTPVNLFTAYYRPPQDLFAADTLRRLALYERGAVMIAGAGELEWISGKARTRRLGLKDCVRPSFMPARRIETESPARTCASRAISILNQQVSCLTDEMKDAEAEALQTRIRDLLPRACAACDDPESAGGFRTYNEPVDAAMRNLYRLHVDKRNDAPAYIAAAKDWAMVLCIHQKKAIERSLESVRFEQQYIKQWRITPVSYAGGAQTYCGKFFDRYVDLDAILGQPDGCTVMAECIVTSPDEREAVLRLGFDERLKAELNGQTIFQEKSRKIAVRDEFSVRVTLRKGENKLTLTVADNMLAYGFFARLSDTSGQYMEDVTVRE